MELHLDISVKEGECPYVKQDNLWGAPGTEGPICGSFILTSHLIAAHWQPLASSPLLCRRLPYPPSLHRFYTQGVPLTCFEACRLLASLLPSLVCSWSRKDATCPPSCMVTDGVQLPTLTVALRTGCVYSSQMCLDSLDLMSEKPELQHDLQQPRLPPGILLLARSLSFSRAEPREDGTQPKKSEPPVNRC